MVIQWKYKCVRKSCKINNTNFYNHNLISSINLVNKSFEHVTNFQNLGTKFINEYFTHVKLREVMSKNVFYLSIQKLYPSHLLSSSKNIKIHRKSISSVLLCGYESWSLIFREESRLRFFENKKMRKTLGFNMEEARINWIKPYSEEPHDLSSLTNITQVRQSWRVRWAGLSTHVGKNINEIQRFGREILRNRPFRRSRSRWNGNNKIGIENNVVGWEWTLLVCFSIGSIGVLLWTWQ